MSEKDELAPWAHPKAQRWFAALFHRTNFPLCLEDELVQPTEQLNLGKVRMMLALAILLGRPETWPSRDRSVLKLILEKSRDFSRLPPETGKGKALTINTHRSHETLIAEMNIEIGLLRRRIGSSPKKSNIDAPSSWEPFWEGSLAMTQPKTNAPSPWEDAGAQIWLQGFRPYRQMIKLIHGTLRLEPENEPHGIRAAAFVVILLCRNDLWPVAENQTIDPVLEEAARQLANVKQLFEQKSRLNPALQANRGFRELLVSLDQEIRILEARLTDPRPEIPNRPPCTWGDYWS